MELNIAIFLFFGAATLAFVALESYFTQRHQVFKSLRRIRAIDMSPSDVRQRELARPFMTRALIPGLARLGKFARRFTPEHVFQRLDQELVYAGSPAGWSGERVMATKIAAAGGLALLMFLLSRVGAMPVMQTIILVPFMGAIGYYLPEWILRSRSGKRQKAIQRALPDALDLMSITVEAGLAFDAAVARVGRQSGGPLGEELHRMIQEMQIGKSRAEALRELGERTTIPELKSFVLAMIQAEVFGISISRVLSVQAKEMRIKRRQRAEEKAQKVPVKIIFPLLFCIFPALFVVIMGPAAITIYDSLIKTS